MSDAIVKGKVKKKLKVKSTESSFGRALKEKI